MEEQTDIGESFAIVVGIALIFIGVLYDTILGMEKGTLLWITQIIFVALGFVMVFQKKFYAISIACLVFFLLNLAYLLFPSNFPPQLSNTNARLLSFCAISVLPYVVYRFFDDYELIIEV